MNPYTPMIYILNNTFGKKFVLPYMHSPEFITSTR